MTTSLVESPKAPKGQYRIIGIDTYDHEGWVDKDEPSLKKAIIYANKNCTPNNNDYHVHNDKGALVWDSGDFVGGTAKSMRTRLKSMVAQKLLDEKDIVPIIRAYLRTGKAPKK